jgi:nitrite reductase (cytochrome c-552)
MSEQDDVVIPPGGSTGDPVARRAVAPRARWRELLPFVLTVAITAIAAFLISALLINISERKQEQRNPFVRLVDVNETTTDPAVWGVNWPREYDSYQRTVDTTRTLYGGSEAMPEQKLDRDPWLKRVFAGYAFSIDYRDRRGHAYMLFDQEQTERVTKKPQPGACLHCHASVAPTWRRIGAAKLGQNVSLTDFQWPAVMAGFAEMSRMSYAQAHAELLQTPDGSPNKTKPGPGGSSVTSPTPANPSGGPPATGPTTQQALAAHVGEAHPVACIDCHDPRSMQIRVTRPGFVNGIRALAESSESVPHLPSIERWRQGNRKDPYDPNADASRQEMRSFVCGQCHVEYYCGPKETLFFPWHNGLKVEQIEKTYEGHKFPDGEPFNDWKHGETGAPVFKAQHPEFEVWSQGVHARSGVACADCHMPYVREGAMKVSDHWVRSPLLMVNRSCQVCHNFPEEELTSRVEVIQGRTRALLARSAEAVVAMLDAMRDAKAAGATPEQLAPVFKLQRMAQWRLDFVSSENSMGFHADQEVARVLAESIDYARQAQALAQGLRTPQAPPTTQQAEPVYGVTPANQSPPAPYKDPNYKGMAAPLPARGTDVKP